MYVLITEEEAVCCHGEQKHIRDIHIANMHIIHSPCVYAG